MRTQRFGEGQLRPYPSEAGLGWGLPVKRKARATGQGHLGNPIEWHLNKIRQFGPSIPHWPCTGTILPLRLSGVIRHEAAGNFIQGCMMTNASTPLFLVLVTSLATTGACSSESTSQDRYQANEVTPKKRQDDAKAQGGTPNTAGTDGAQDAPQRVETDNDRYWIDNVVKSCTRRDFKGFFESFVRSAAVRERYTADPIAVSSKGVVTQSPRNRYFDFPIAMTDYRYISKNSENSEPNEFLWLTFDQSQSNKYRVDWVRVRYAGIGNDAEGEAEITGTYGLPGYLIFEPTDKCWRLVEDSVYEGPYVGSLSN